MALLLLGSALAASAEEKKAEKKEPPRITCVSPVGLVRGAANHLRIRGVSLADATAVRLVGGAVSVAATIKTQGKSEPPKPLEAARAGDSQIEADVTLPADAAPAPAGSTGSVDSAGGATLSVVVSTPAGDTPPLPLLVLDPAQTVDEKEPNGGFRTAQEIELGKVVRGTVGEPADVDVFKFIGRAGQRVVAEVDAARHGSLLDSVLTLFDARGHILAANDEGEGTGGADSLLRCDLPADGWYYLALNDANDTGGPSHAYVLSVYAKGLATPSVAPATTRTTTRETKPAPATTRARVLPPAANAGR